MPQCRSWITLYLPRFFKSSLSTLSCVDSLLQWPLYRVHCTEATVQRLDHAVPDESLQELLLVHPVLC